ncbi:MAG TPA: DoxX family protein [Gemmatimonadaceae bacterium]|nr:DoxX family protein [Gemmatimonadaceae bacterium]
MPSATLARPVPRSRMWAGRIVTVLVVLFMMFDGVLHLLVPPPVVQAFAQLGVPLHLSIGIALLELAYTALYAIPRTATIGALLLTAYLGGATALQLRAEAALFPVLFPVIVGALVWAGLMLRDARVGILILRRPER